MYVILFILFVVHCNINCFISYAVRLHNYVHGRHTQLGPIFCESLGGRAELVFISEPQLMKSLFLSLEGKYPVHILPEPWLLYDKLYGSKRGLFFMNGEEWLINRRIMNKHLLREGTDKWLEMSIKGTVSCFVQDLKVKTAQGNVISDLESEFYGLSLNGKDIESYVSYVCCLNYLY